MDPREKGLLEKTGKTLQEWVGMVRSQSFEKHGQIMTFLKQDHGMTHGYANMVALKARESDAGPVADDALLQSQYSNGKEHLKTIHDSLVDRIQGFGNDIEFVPKKGSVSVRRKRQFVLIQPSTKTRLDLGLKLPGREMTERLEGSGPFGTMCTHRVRIEDVSQVDDELIGWILEAYEAAG